MPDLGYDADFFFRFREFDAMHFRSARSGGDYQTCLDAAGTFILRSSSRMYGSVIEVVTFRIVFVAVGSHLTNALTCCL